jgi:hypothetical protein
MPSEWGLTFYGEQWQLMDYDEERIAKPAYEEARRRGLGEAASRNVGWEAVREYHAQCPDILVEQRRLLFLHPNTSWAEVRREGKKQVRERFCDPTSPASPTHRVELSLADLPHNACLLWRTQQRFWLSEGLSKEDAERRAWEATLPRLDELRKEHQRWEELFGRWGCGG